MLGVVLAILASSPRATRAEGKGAFLAEQVRKNSDFRVRTSAALSLGTSDDPAAVKPLCGCLDDDSEIESVRLACAAALGKLKRPGGDVCLKAHSADVSRKVKEQVNASLKALGGGAAGSSGTGDADGSCPNVTPASTVVTKPKYYVGLSVSNKSTRPDAEIKPLVARELRCQLTSMQRFVVAPDDAVEPKKMAEALRKHKLDGYYLSIQIDPIKYDSGSLKVSMRLLIMTSTRDIKGEIGKQLEMPGMTGPSKSDEDDLIKMAAQRLVGSFADLKP